MKGDAAYTSVAGVGVGALTEGQVSRHTQTTKIQHEEKRKHHKLYCSCFNTGSMEPFVGDQIFGARHYTSYPSQEFLSEALMKAKLNNLDSHVMVCPRKATTNVIFAGSCVDHKWQRAFKSLGNEKLIFHYSKCNACLY